MRNFTINFVLPVTAMLAIGLIFSGCRKNFLKEEEEGMQLQTLSAGGQIQYADGSATVLGQQYPIPFTPEVMTEAKRRLDSMQIYNPTPVNIRTTHLYVKFSLNSEQQLEILEDDSTLMLSDIPLDHEVIVQGSWYKEQGLPDSVPTPHYAVVKSNYQFNPNVPYTILSNLYVPDEDATLLGPQDTGEYYADMMIYTAYDVIGFPEWRPYEFMPAPGHYFEDGPGGGGPPSPNGVIKIYDTRLATYIPLEGVRVTAKKHLWGSAFRQGYTNADGIYYMDDYQKAGTSTYTIWFNRDFHFTVKDNMFSESKVVRYKQNKSYWAYNIGEGYECMQGHMFRAAYRYYFKDIDGLKRPLRPLSTQRLIAKNTDKSWAGINYVAFPILKVARYDGPGETNEYSSDEIYGITIHELAHTAHVLSMNNILDYLNVNNQIQESWAIGVQWQLTNKEYRERGLSTYGSETYYAAGLRRPHTFAFQYWKLIMGPNPLGPGFPDVPITGEYTSLFINLVDNFNELGQNFNPFPAGEVDDQVNGYNLGTIQANYLKHMYAKSSLSTQLKANKPSGVTNAQIDLLLSYY